MSQPEQKLHPYFPSSEELAATCSKELKEAIDMYFAEHGNPMALARCRANNRRSRHFDRIGRD